MLDEQIPFLEGRPVKPEEESYYDLPNRSEESATLYEHCVRAIEHGLHFGEHGLPLMGSGDWNDGMNLVGKEGRGESVWLAFFLYDVLMQFAELARAREDVDFRRTLPGRGEAVAGEHRDNMRWDGEWYRRAYFDDGAPLGSADKPRMPDRFASAKLVGDQRRRRSATLASGDGRRRSAPRPPRMHTHPALRSAVRQVGAQSRLHQRLRSRRAREWRPVHARRHLDRDGLRAHGRQRARVGTVRADQSDHTMARPPKQIATYKVEPYVVAADVYAVAPHTGRGGWTWYTGSAGWMYRLLTESLLGVHLEGNRLRVIPRFPPSWTSYKIHYRYRQTLYHITISRLAPDRIGANELSLDGQTLTEETIPLTDDHLEHFVELRAR